MRSGVGAFCDAGFGFLFDFEEVVFFFVVVCAGAGLGAAYTAGAALSKSTAPK
jgi:hypothetical protein